MTNKTGAARTATAPDTEVRTAEDAATVTSDEPTELEKLTARVERLEQILL